MSSQAAENSSPSVFEDREFFEEALIRETAFARRHEIRLALFLIEIDGLGKAEEKTRAELAARLRNLISTDEVVLARISNDVLAVVLRGFDADSARLLSERLAATVMALEAPTRFSATIGVSIFHTSRAATPEAMFRAAELALLDAKKQGRAVVQADGLPAPAATPPT